MTMFIVHRFKKIFPNATITLNLLENTGCELWRSFKATFKNLQQTNSDYEEVLIEEVPITVLLNDDIRVESPVKDVYYFISYRNNPQNLFSIEMGRNGSSGANPYLWIKNTASKSNEFFHLTDWKSSSKNETNKNLLWYAREEKDKMNLTTKIHIEDYLVSLYDVDKLNERLVNQREAGKRVISQTQFFSQEGHYCGEPN